MAAARAGLGPAPARLESARAGPVRRRRSARCVSNARRALSFGRLRCRRGGGVSWPDAVRRVSPDALGVSSRAALDRPSVLQAAALLHTDVAASFWRRGRNEDASSHIELARRFAEASAGPSEASDIFRRRWYLGAALLHARHLAPGEAIAFFDRATRAAPNDVAILTAKAWLHERVALFPGLSRGASLARVEATRNRHLAEAPVWRVRLLPRIPRRPRLLCVWDGSKRCAAGSLKRAASSKTSSLAARAVGNSSTSAGSFSAPFASGREGGMMLQPCIRRRRCCRRTDSRHALPSRFFTRNPGTSDVRSKPWRPVVSPRPERRLENDPWADYLLGPIPFGDLVLDALRVEVRRP